jgi:hypothetical protein
MRTRRPRRIIKMGRGMQNGDMRRNDDLDSWNMRLAYDHSTELTSRVQGRRSSLRRNPYMAD